MTKFGVNIKKIRKTKGLSQQSLADIFNITRGNISSYEDNRAEPRLETIISIANYFGITIEKLLTKDLTINEILQFNSDKIIEDEQRLSNLKLKDVYFISDDILAKGLHQDISFEDFDQFPLIKIPDTSTSSIIALSFNSNIPHHQYFEQFPLNDLLFFRNIDPANIHLLDQKMGMSLSSHSIVLGQFIQEPDQEITFFLNQQYQEKVDLQQTKRYWKLFASYKHL